MDKNLNPLNFADLVICCSRALRDKVKTLTDTETICIEDSYEL